MIELSIRNSGCLDSGPGVRIPDTSSDQLVDFTIEIIVARTVKWRLGEEVDMVSELMAVACEVEDNPCLRVLNGPRAGTGC